MGLPDGYNCELPIGEDNSNNAYSSTNVVANADGSLIERLEYIQSLIDTEITSIKAKTDNLPNTPADQTLIDAKLGVVTDIATNQTLLGYQNSLYQHVHNQSRVYPTLANGVVVTGGAGVWQLGAFVEIIPANAIASAFDIHWINFEDASATDVYEFVLYKGLGGSEVEIGRIRTIRDAAQSGTAKVPIQIPAQNANTRISAKVASKSGGGDTVTVSVYYHIYT